MADIHPQNELTFSLADVTAVLKRRFWWFAIPSVLGVVAALVVALIWPATYESSSIVAVDPQEIPEDLVSSTVVADTESRFNQISLQILARDNMSEIIDEFGLFADVSAPREELIEQLRADIVIAPLPPAIVDPRKAVTVDSFRIAFRHSDAQTAANVANELTRDFVAANLRLRANEAQGTRDFLESQLTNSRVELAQVANEHAGLQLEFAGALPENLDANERKLDRLSGDRSGNQMAIRAAQEQISRIRLAIDELRTSGSDSADDPVSRKNEIELLLSHYAAQGKTELHPDVLIAEAELQALDELIDERKDQDQPLSPQESILRRELRDHEVRASVLASGMNELDEQIEALEVRISETPANAAQLGALVTRIRSLEGVIASLEAKRATAALGQSAELAQKGERFRIIEGAVPSLSPVSPNRPLILVVGISLGFVVGLSLLMIRELSDRSFYNLGDLQSSLELPVLGAIPVIQLPADLARARARMRRWAVAGVVILAIIAGGTLAYLLANQTSSVDDSAETAHQAAPAEERSHV